MPPTFHQSRAGLLANGDFSGLHLSAIEYIGFKFIDPTVDIGLDIAAECAEARRE